MRFRSGRKWKGQESNWGKESYGKEDATGEKALRERSAYGKERRVGKQTAQESNTSLEGVSRWGAIKVGKNQQNLKISLLAQIPCPSR